MRLTRLYLFYTYLLKYQPIMTFTDTVYHTDNDILTGVETNNESKVNSHFESTIPVDINDDTQDHVFPPLSSNEIDILKTWERECYLNDVFDSIGIESLNLLIQVLWNKIKDKTDPVQGASISMADRLNNFGFTPVEETIYKNPFCELACLLFIRNSVIQKDDESEIERINNLVGSKIKKLFQYLNFI